MLRCLHQVPLDWSWVLLELLWPSRRKWDYLRYLTLNLAGKVPYLLLPFLYSLFPNPEKEKKREVWEKKYLMCTTEALVVIIVQLLGKWLLICGSWIVISVIPHHAKNVLALHVLIHTNIVIRSLSYLFAVCNATRQSTRRWRKKQPAREGFMLVNMHLCVRWVYLDLNANTFWLRM